MLLASCISKSRDLPADETLANPLKTSKKTIDIFRDSKQGSLVWEVSIYCAVYELWCQTGSKRDPYRVVLPYIVIDLHIQISGVQVSIDLSNNFYLF